MESSERINTIVEISRRLGSEDWAVIDLTLRQFGVSTTDNWNGNSVDYIIAMLEDAESDVLARLGRHMGLELDKNRPATIPDFWQSGCLRLFISHLAKHKNFAASLKSTLRPFGISSFVAHNDIAPSREWEDEIEAALGTCDAALAVMHPEFHKSFWVDQELGYVMGRGIPVLAARLGQDPYGFLGRFQALKTRKEDPDVLANEIFRVLVSHKITSARMTSALVTRLEQSDSFANAKENIERLEKAVFWDKSMSHRCRNSIDRNSQVKESWHVPERIEKLISRMEKHS